jgi:hypothetical protein
VKRRPRRRNTFSGFSALTIIIVGFSGTYVAVCWLRLQTITCVSFCRMR